MLSQERIEETLHIAMLKFAEKNDGADGWDRKELEHEIFQAGGDDDDLLCAMKLGMDLCGYEGIEHFHFNPDADEKDALSLLYEIENALSVILADAESVRGIALETAGRVSVTESYYLHAMHALALEQRQYAEQIEDDIKTIRHRLKKNMNS